MLFPGPDHLTDKAHGVIGFGKSAEAAIGPVGYQRDRLFQREQFAVIFQHISFSSAICGQRHQVMEAQLLKIAIPAAAHRKNGQRSL